MTFVGFGKLCINAALFFRMKTLEKVDVAFCPLNDEFHKILDGLLPKEKDYVKFMGKKNIFVAEDSTLGEKCDSLRAAGESVFGGSPESDKLENERSHGQKVMKEAGMHTKDSTNFKGKGAFEEAVAFVKKNGGRWVIKQNGEASKLLSYVGKFDNGDDMVDRLNDYIQVWTKDVDFDLQPFIKGDEIAAGGWFNGADWIKDKQGEPIFIANFEHKKRSDGDTGSTTGETGTLARRTQKGAKINAEMLKMTSYLKKIKYTGPFDVNFMFSREDAKFYVLEPTTRFGYPTLNLHAELLKSPYSELIQKCATGGNGIEVDPRWAVVISISVPPYPFEVREEMQNARGQRIYIKTGGRWTGKDNLTHDVLRHLHFYEVRYDKESKHLVCSGDFGEAMDVTAMGATPKEANTQALKFIKDTVETSSMDHRHDIGINERVQNAVRFAESNKLI